MTDFTTTSEGLYFAPRPHRGRRMARGLWSFTTTKKLGAVGAVIVLTMIVFAVFAELIAPFAIDHQVLSERFLGPSATHIFGTDNLGRDMFSRTVFGARESLSIALSAAALNLVAATLIGTISGYYGKWVDLVVQRVVDAWISMPGLLVIILFVSVFGPSKLLIIILIGGVGAAATSRIVRGAVLATKQNQYVEAARVLGASDARIMVRHILPNIAPIIIVFFTINAGVYLITEASLSFLGFGTPPPAPTWGRTLNVSRTFLFEPWLAFWPGLFLTLTVFGFQVFGDALRDVIDPRLRAM